MTSNVSDDMKDELIKFLSMKEPAYWYFVANDWEQWNNGTWILEWIASQKNCTKATAQLIFWKCNPDQFLPTRGRDEWVKTIDDNKEVFTLVQLILQNWKRDFYCPDYTGLSAAFRRVSGVRQDRFWGDGERFYDYGTIGFLGDGNPIPRMEAYRRAESTCNKASLPWHLPDELGMILIEKRPAYCQLPSTAGFPNEFIEHYERTHSK